MGNIASLLLIALFLGLGLAAGRLSRRKPSATLLLDACLYALLFTMGLRIGESEAIRMQIARVGLIAVASAAASVLGTIVIVGGAVVVRGRSNRVERNVARVRGARAVMVHLKDPLRLFAAVVSGFLVGLLLPLLAEGTIGRITTLLLYILILLVGYEVSRGGVRLRSALLRPSTLIVPAGTVVGSLAGAAAIAPLLSLPVGKSLSVAAGFGWYSLSGVMITNLGDPVLGSAAFLANMLREGIALLLIPSLGGAGLCEAAIGVAGATSMDVTLPVITRSCGSSFVPLSVASGTILSVLVPLLVPLFFHL